MKWMNKLVRIFKFYGRNLRSLDSDVFQPFIFRSIIWKCVFWADQKIQYPICYSIFRFRSFVFHISWVQALLVNTLLSFELMKRHTTYSRRRLFHYECIFLKLRLLMNVVNCD
jgi:hypothetical protein